MSRIVYIEKLGRFKEEKKNNEQIGSGINVWKHKVVCFF